MEDYRVLNNDQKKIKEDFKKREIVSEMGQGLKVRKSLFSQYPKFLRCNGTLFPNNYLDIIELKDKEKLLDVYYQLNKIIMNLDTKERDILNFINDSSDHRFIIGSLLKVFFHSDIMKHIYSLNFS